MDHALGAMLKYDDLEMIKQELDCVEQTTITAVFSKPSPISDRFEMICINRDDMSLPGGDPKTSLPTLTFDISKA